MLDTRLGFVALARLQIADVRLAKDKHCLLACEWWYDPHARSAAGAYWNQDLSMQIIADTARENRV
jgi:hypothetical protein